MTILSMSTQIFHLSFMKSGNASSSCKPHLWVMAVSTLHKQDQMRPKILAILDFKAIFYFLYFVRFCFLKRKMLFQKKSIFWSLISGRTITNVLISRKKKNSEVNFTHRFSFNPLFQTRCTWKLNRISLHPRANSLGTYCNLTITQR